MMAKKFIKTCGAVFLALLAYVLIGNVFHHVISPESVPGADMYPVSGDVIVNPFAGERILFRKAGIETNGAYSEREMTLQPHGAVPQPHIHALYDENFTVLRGRLTIVVAGAAHEFGPGQSLTIPRGVPHQPFNNSDEEVVTINRVTPAEKHDLMLAQVHGFFTEKATPRTDFFLQAMLYAVYYDTYLAGMPIPAQKALSFTLAPTARLMGYRSWRREYSLKWKAAERR